MWRDFKSVPTNAKVINGNQTYVKNKHDNIFIITTVYIAF